MDMARKSEVIDKMQTLDATDKALIVYYAYIMLCDSVAAHSVKVLGKKFTSEEIQAFFGQKAVNELRLEGLIRALPISREPS